jgi:hypothetical protein
MAFSLSGWFNDCSCAYAAFSPAAVLVSPVQFTALIVLMMLGLKLVTAGVEVTPSLKTTRPTVSRLFENWPTKYAASVFIMLHADAEVPG